MIKVLDKGFVRLVDVMGTDSDIAEAARTSYGKGTKTLSEDKTLIRYLIRHRHTSPFEMVEMKFHLKVPMDIWRQFVRHRTASINEYSTRYSEAIVDKKETKYNEWRIQAKNNKQGSSGFIESEIGKILTEQEQDLHEKLTNIYNSRISIGIAREQARKDLPLCNYTEAYWKLDLHNLFHFLKLRLDTHAQYEIREYANAISTFVQNKFPISYEAFTDYVLYAQTFSKLELNTLSKLLGDIEFTKDMVTDLFPSNNNREKEEFLNKLKIISSIVD